MIFGDTEAPGGRVVQLWTKEPVTLTLHDKDGRKIPQRWAQISGDDGVFTVNVPQDHSVQIQPLIPIEELEKHSKDLTKDTTMVTLTVDYDGAQPVDVATGKGEDLRINPGQTAAVVMAPEDTFTVAGYDPARFGEYDRATNSYKINEILAALPWDQLKDGELPKDSVLLTGQDDPEEDGYTTVRYAMPDGWKSFKYKKSGGKLATAEIMTQVASLVTNASKGKMTDADRGLLDKISEAEGTKTGGTPLPDGRTRFTWFATDEEVARILDEASVGSIKFQILLSARIAELEEELKAAKAKPTAESEYKQAQSEIECMRNSNAVIEAARVRAHETYENAKARAHDIEIAKIAAGPDWTR